MTSDEPSTPAPLAKPPRKTWGEMTWRERAGGLGCLLVIGVVVIGIIGAVQAPRQPSDQSVSTPRPAAAQVSGLGTRQQGIEFLARHGFTGEESPLTDGGQRWLLRGPNSSIAEPAGPPGDLASISLTTVATGASGTVAGEWLSRYAPNRGIALLNEVLQDAPAQDQNRSVDLGDRTLQIQTLAAVDGVIVILSVVED